MNAWDEAKCTWIVFDVLDTKFWKNSWLKSISCTAEVISNTIPVSVLYFRILFVT